MVKLQLNTKASSCVRLIFLLAIVLVQSSCNAQTKKNKLKTDSYKPNFKKEESLGKEYFDIETQMKPFVDSLNYCNYLDSSFRIPTFLFENCFDLKPTLWKGLHNPISLRMYIAQKISNTDLIIKLIQRLSTEEKFKPCKTKYDIPNKENSFKELLGLRLKELSN